MELLQGVLAFSWFGASNCSIFNSMILKAMVQNNEAGVYQMKTEKGDKITVLWTDMEKGWIVRVTGYNISKEDMLRISESVEIR